MWPKVNAGRRVNNDATRDTTGRRLRHVGEHRLPKPMHCIAEAKCDHSLRQGLTSATQRTVQLSVPRYDQRRVATA